MAFHFTACRNPEISDIVYILPPLPYGTSYSLRKLIDNYDAGIRDGADGSEDEPYAAITTYEARSLSDVIAKLLIKLHYEYRGLDGESGKLVLALNDIDHGAVLGVQQLLADLYEQLPQNWADALRVYRAKLLAERDYDRRIWTPGYEAAKAGHPGNSKAIEREMEKLQDDRCSAEAYLLDIPAPSLEEFAVKYLICFDNDRDMNGYHEALCDEAKRLLNIQAGPEGDDLQILLGNLDWRAA